MVSGLCSSRCVISSRRTSIFGMRGDEVGYAARELDAVDGERVTCGDGAGVGGLQEEGAGAAHLLFEQPGSGVFAFALEGVGTD